MSFTVIRPDSHEAWLEFRKAGIGSSEVGTILGLNPYETPYQLWRRKMGIDPPVAENFAMRAGHYLEDAVSMFFHDATGYNIDKSSAGDWLAVSDERPYMRVSPDRIYWIPDRPQRDENRGILECKTTKMDIDEDDVPQRWYAQLQYQLGVTDTKRGALAWLIAGSKFGHKEYMFDRAFYEHMVIAVERFWRENILGERAPEPISVEDVVLRSPRHVAGKQVLANDGLIAACSEIKVIKEQMDELNARKRELERDIKMSMDDAETLVGKGLDGSLYALATWKASKDTNKFDEKRFAAENPELYKQYQTTQAGTRRFLIK